MDGVPEQSAKENISPHERGSNRRYKNVYNDVPYNLYTSSNNMRFTNSIRMLWVWHAARITALKNTF
jgi:hypothetical protein